MREKGAVCLFESARKHKYTDRGVRKMLECYAAVAGITRSMSPHKWRHFLFTWLKEGRDVAKLSFYVVEIGFSGISFMGKLYTIIT
jgi:integrase/recombinase XerD